MSTYTDLHNKIKETVNVEYRTRETTQKVKLHNIENEYWGTFTGSISANTFIDPKFDSTEFGKVSLDYILSAINEIKLLRAEVDALRDELAAANLVALNAKINKVSADLITLDANTIDNNELSAAFEQLSVHDPHINPVDIDTMELEELVKDHNNIISAIFVASGYHQH